MPGLIGCLTVGAAAASATGRAIASEALDDLRHDPDYQVETADVTNGSVALVSTVAGAAHTAIYRSGDGLTVALQGEVYGPDLPRTAPAAERARLLGVLCRRRGHDFPRGLNGSFVLFIDDAISGEQVVMNDAHASRHIFYAQSAGTLWFAPELKSFTRFANLGLTLDLESFLTYFANGHLFQSQTFFEEVHPLPPGTCLRIRNGRLDFNRYFRFDPMGDGADAGEESYKRRLGELLLASVERRLGDNRRSVIPLSGGWDSRAILGCALRLRSAGEIQTVSWGIDENAPESDPWVARRIAQSVGTRHRFIRRRTEQFTSDIAEMVWRIDGLTDDPAAHHNELDTMKSIVKECAADSILRGDQIFGEPAKPHNDVEALAMLPLRFPHEVSSVKRVVDAGVFRDALAASVSTAASIRRSPRSNNPTDRADHWYFNHRIVTYLNRSSYYKLTVLELQNPWLDREILEFLQTLPSRYRSGFSLYLKTLRWMFPELMSIPRNEDKGLENWRQVLASNSAIQTFIRDHLTSEQSDLWNWIDRRALDELLKTAFSQPRDARYSGKAMASAKAVARAVIPSWYGALKAGVRTHVRADDIPIEYLLFRLLVAKLWLDRVRRPVADGARVS